MAITGRMKLLLAVAIAVVIYVVATKPDDPGSSASSSVAGAAPAVRERSNDTGGVGQGAASKPGGRNVSSAGSDESARLFAQLSHRVSDDQSSGALFKSTSWYTAPPPPPPAPVVVVAPPAPVAPPVPFAVMGSYSRPGERKTYFLTRGDRVFDVHVGDTIDNTYSVDGESGGQLQLTYKPLNIQQTLPLGG